MNFWRATKGSHILGDTGAVSRCGIGQKFDKVFKSGKLLERRPFLPDLLRAAPTYFPWVSED